MFILKMSEVQDKMSYEDILAENLMLKNKCDELINQNKLLEGKLRTLQDNQGYEICKYFNECNSLKKTAEYFLYENIVDCGYAVIEFNGCSDSISDAVDYKEFHILAYGKDNSEDDSGDDSGDETEDLTEDESQIET